MGAQAASSQGHWKLWTRIVPPEGGASDLQGDGQQPGVRDETEGGAQGELVGVFLNQVLAQRVGERPGEETRLAGS